MITQRKIKIPSATNFIKLLLIQLPLFFIPFMLATYYDEVYHLFIVSAFYLFLFTFGYHQRPNYKNDILYKLIAPIIGLFVVFGGFGLDFKSLQKAIIFLTVENKDKFLIVSLIQCLSVYFVLKFLFPGVDDENKNDRRK